MLFSKEDISKEPPEVKTNILLKACIFLFFELFSIFAKSKA